MAFRYFNVDYKVEHPSKATVAFSAGLTMPRRLRVSALGFLGFDVRIEVDFQDGKYVATEVAVRQRPGGPAVTGESLRDVTVHDFVRYAARDAALDEVEEDGNRVFHDLLTKLRPPRETPGRGHDEELLRWVAQAYEVAYALNEPPTKTVQSALNVSRATAGRWVAEARRRGLLTVGED